MQDKRKHKRYIKRCEIEFSTNGTTYRGISSNFSLSGLFIKTSKPFTEDTAVDLIVHLPNGLISKLKGIVKRALRNPVNIQKNGMGIELIVKDSHYNDFINSISSNVNVDHDKSKEPRGQENPVPCPIKSS
jgi:hypothetical protein